MHNQSHNQPHPDNREAAMARADLYKLANYSMKLFKMIRDGDELEGWVQAKVTKAADYIASVYHYMEYEMKFSEYGDKLENSDMYSEAVRNQFTAKLMEAKVKLEKLKEKNQKDLDEVFDDKAKVGDSYKTSKGGTVTKTDKGIRHERDPKSYSDEDGDAKSGKGTKSHAKSQSAAEKKAQAPKQKQSPKSAKTWGMKDGEKFDNRDKKVSEGSKPDFLDIDKDGDKKEPMKKAVGDKKAGPKKGVNPFAKKDEAVKEATDTVEKDASGKVKSWKHEGDWEKSTGKKDGRGKVTHLSDKARRETEKFDALKHVKNPTKGEKTAAKDVKRGSYADRAAMLRSAEKDGRLKEHAELAANTVLAKLRG